MTRNPSFVFSLHVTLKPIHARQRRRDATRQLSHVGIGGVYWALCYVCDYPLLRTVVVSAVVVVYNDRLLVCSH